MDYSQYMESGTKEDDNSNAQQVLHIMYYQPESETGWNEIIYPQELLYQ